MRYGYARVSTVHQDLQGQLQALKNEGCETIFQDKLTGTNKNRPQLQRLLHKIQKDDTPTGRLILNVMLAFAEFERDMIVERTQEGKAIAKQNPDFREGRPKVYSKKQIEHALKLKETHTYRQVEDKTGISKSTLIRAKRKSGPI